jgi:RNA polymerase sigma-70 factor (family 1)
LEKIIQAPLESSMIFFFPKISRYAEYFLKTTFECEDTVSEVFLELWNNRKTLTKVKNLEGYIYTITKNKALRVLNQNRKEKHVTYDLDHFSFLIEHETPEEVQINKELNVLINKAISELPKRCQLVFLMAREEGLKYKEIAEKLSISEKTVNAQMVTAIKKLTTSLLGVFSKC